MSFASFKYLIILILHNKALYINNILIRVTCAINCSNFVRYQYLMHDKSCFPNNRPIALSFKNFSSYFFYKCVSNKKNTVYNANLFFGKI